jgi:hypothetical protein
MIAGNRPVNEFLIKCLQCTHVDADARTNRDCSVRSHRQADSRRAGVGHIWHAKSVRTEGRRVGAYKFSRAVIVAMAEGTLPLKRLYSRLLCHSSAVARQ